MPVVEKVTLEILTDSELKKTEQKIIKLEELAKRKQTAQNKISNRKTKQSGIFASSEGQEALPSSVLRKRRKEDSLGLSGGRLDNSTQKLVGDKIKADTEEKFNRTERIMSALGIDVGSKKKVSKGSLVSGAGSPVQKSNAFKKLSSKVGKLESNQKALAQSFTDGAKSLVNGASGLTTPSGIVTAALSASRLIPGVGTAIGVAAFVAERFVAQHGRGGTRDTAKKVLDEDVSDIGVENETDVFSGAKLFLSNPMNNQGLPRGNSNTANLRDGIRIYNRRQEGSYL